MQPIVQNSSGSKLEQTSATEEQHANIQAALARTLIRSLTLYFSRPVRLFRPQKVSGWQSLSAQYGKFSTPQHIISLVKDQGFTVISKHFIPPMVVNTLLGTVLWTTYSEASKLMEMHCGHNPIFTTAVAGGVAGGMQALAAAPAENVRIMLEGGLRGYSGVEFNAWKEVFRNTSHVLNSGSTDIKDARQVRHWIKQVKEMAGHGWRGWGWGFGKDICGFSVFFSVFELTRWAALRVGAASQPITMKAGTTTTRKTETSSERDLPRIVHCIVLVTGGVMAGLAYELTCRPWDIARRTVQHSMIMNNASRPIWAFSATVILRKVQQDGILSFFRHTVSPKYDATNINSQNRRKVQNLIKALSRVGPWGVGFLVWEIYGVGSIKSFPESI